MTNKQDKLFVLRKDGASFAFDQSVVQVFDDMLNRSVPFYQEAQRMMVELAVELAQPSSQIYDLGCSHGNTAFLMANLVRGKSIKVVGIDNSAEMIKAAKLRKRNSKKSSNLSFECRDVTKSLALNDASVVILSLTLQFIRPAERPDVLKTIYNSMRPGGVLILLEKNIASNAEVNSLFIDLYYRFKKRNSYSDIEISKKRLSLENVLVPYSIEENFKLLESSGFVGVSSFFQWYNFSGLMAFKKGKRKK